jgi:hypothetical protein
MFSVKEWSETSTISTVEIAVVTKLVNYIPKEKKKRKRNSDIEKELNYK